MRFAKEKGLAVCGLGCVLCSEESCPGCKARGCKEQSSCSVYRCATGKGLDGCYECDGFPCGEDMLKGVRNRAFNLYARRYGKEALLERLKINCENGLTYHRLGGLKGDYDLPDNEDDILRLIAFGTADAYQRCPVLASEHFTLRLVQADDASDLLDCYSDPEAQKVMNADCCTSGFRYTSSEEVEECIAFFLHNYECRKFVRLAIVDKTSGRAVGTAELFDPEGGFAGAKSWGVLRLDIASAYERAPYLDELLKLCVPVHHQLFGVELILLKAIPEAKERVHALQAVGFTPFLWPDGGREHYWAHRES